MRLSSFEVNNYRSIISSEKIQIKDYMVIIGKNNVGKTNLLHALNMAFETMKINAQVRRNPITRDSRFVFERDFPLNVKKTVQETIIIMDFNLEDDEIKEFRNKVKISNNGIISIEMKFTETSESIRFLGKRGRGGLSYDRNKKTILQFILNKLEFLYIPAIRTDNQSVRIIDQLVTSELNTLESNEEYREAIKTVRKLETKLLNEISHRIEKPIKEFLPQMRKIHLDIEYDYRTSQYGRNIKFYLDDGTLTDIYSKGEGIKSLVSLALLNNRNTKSHSRLIAIEEPESHLHPEAIHQVNQVLKQLSTNTNVIISTHNPIFANAQQLSNNLIVSDGSVYSARNLSQIRSILGSKIFDNLYLAEKILIVEGDDDRKAFEHMLTIQSEKIKIAIEQNRLKLLPLGGATKLSYQSTLLKSLIIDFRVILDNDLAGNTAISECIERSLLDNKHLIVLSCKVGESEFEDMLEDSFIYDILIDYNYNNSIKAHKYKKLNWSSRTKHLFLSRGLLWNDTIENEIKSKINEKILKTTQIDYLNGRGKEIFESLVNLVEDMIDNKSNI
jgi:predicted ATP-dependent endonuclease of OLD family